MCFKVLLIETIFTRVRQGSTKNLRKRFDLHNKGCVKSSKTRKPWKLVYYEAYLREKAARTRESRVKKSGSVSVPLIKRISEFFINTSKLIVHRPPNPIVLFYSSNFVIISLVRLQEMVPLGAFFVALALLNHYQ